MKVLIVRLSSMGDLVHTLPAVSDAARAISGISFDWVVDESFAQVPSWHRSVDDVIPGALKRWGRTIRDDAARREFRSFVKRVRAKRYDLIVDLQGELKSASIARLARGIRAGYDRMSVHEWGAQFAYQNKYQVPKQKHSLQRMRVLLSHALGYSYSEEKVDYGVDRSRLESSAVAIPGPYLVFVHSTSWASKCWPEAYWQELISQATQDGLSVVLPWGNQAEYQLSLRLAGTHKEVVVLPQLSISEKAAIISGALATVGLDTGLSHIAAALDIPSVTIYGATDPALVGATGKHQVHIASNFECVKCHEEKCSYGLDEAARPACLFEVTPQQVWSELQELMTNVAVW